MDFTNFDTVGAGCLKEGVYSPNALHRIDRATIMIRISLMLLSIVSARSTACCSSLVRCSHSEAHSLVSLRSRMSLQFVLHGLLWALVGSGGAVLPSAEAQDLNVNSDTTISSSETYDNTYVAPSASDNVSLDVTTGGGLTNNAELFVGLSGTGTLYVSGGSVTNAGSLPMGPFVINI